MEFETPFDMVGRIITTELTFWAFQGRTKFLLNFVLNEGNGINGKGSRHGIFIEKMTL